MRSWMLLSCGVICRAVADAQPQTTAGGIRATLELQSQVFNLIAFSGTGTL